MVPTFVTNSALLKVAKENPWLDDVPAKGTCALDPVLTEYRVIVEVGMGYGPKEKKMSPSASALKRDESPTKRYRKPG
jgi:hypothetical protein